MLSQPYNQGPLLSGPFLAVVFMAAFFIIGPLSTGAIAKPETGKPAPGFSLPDLFGTHSQVNVQSLSGKIILIDFWASWCPPCRKSLPELGRLKTRYPDLKIIAVSIDEDKKKALDFLKKPDSNILFLHDVKRVVAEQFDLGGMPSAYLIDRKGILRNRFDGYGETDMLKIEKEIKKLLEEKP